MTSNSKAAYLQKYLSGGDSLPGLEDTKKAKKKKKDKKKDKASKAKSGSG